MSYLVSLTELIEKNMSSSSIKLLSPGIYSCKTEKKLIVLCMFTNLSNQMDAGGRDITKQFQELNYQGAEQFSRIQQMSRIAGRLHQRRKPGPVNSIFLSGSGNWDHAIKSPRAEETCSKAWVTKMITWTKAELSMPGMVESNEAPGSQSLQIWEWNNIKQNATRDWLFHQKEQE